MISLGQSAAGIAGGMCQFTNLIHWMVLHTPLEIVEHHHHDDLDLFPDFHRQIPFGTGTSIFYNYLDYRFRNPTDSTYQLLVWTTDTHLCGELRRSSHRAMPTTSKWKMSIFPWRTELSTAMGQFTGRPSTKGPAARWSRILLRRNHAKVLYDTSQLTVGKSERRMIFRSSASSNWFQSLSNRALAGRGNHFGIAGQIAGLDLRLRADPLGPPLGQAPRRRPADRPYGRGCQWRSDRPLPPGRCCRPWRPPGRHGRWRAAGGAGEPAGR